MVGQLEAIKNRPISLKLDGVILAGRFYVIDLAIEWMGITAKALERQSVILSFRGEVREVAREVYSNLSVMVKLCIGVREDSKRCRLSNFKAFDSTVIVFELNVFRTVSSEQIDKLA